MLQVRGSGTLIVCVLAILALLPFSDAQTPTRDRPFPELLDARPWGPFEVDLSFQIKNIGFDDNLFLVPEDHPAGKENDFVVKLGPEFKAQTNFGRRFSLTLYDELLGEVFLSHSNLNHADNTFRAQFDALLGATLLTAEGEWRTRQNRPNSEIDERTRVNRILLEGRARLFVGAKTDIVLSAKTSETRYKDSDSAYFVDLDGDGTLEITDLSQALDRDTDTVSIELGWSPLGKTRFHGQFRQRNDTFLGRSADNKVQETRMMLGASFRPTAFLSGKIQIGRAELKSEDLSSPKKPFDGLVSDTQLVYKPTRRTKFLLDYEVGARFSAYENNFYFEETLQGLRVETYLGAIWGLQAGGSLRTLDYPEETLVVGGEPGATLPPRADEIKDVFGGILIALRSGLNLGIRIGVRDRTSNIARFEDRQTYVSTSGSFSF